MVSAVERVRERLRRVTTALQASGIRYAVVGGNAVAAWVARVDESAVRNTQDVDLLIERGDLNRVTLALHGVGFSFCHVKGIDMFLDGAAAKARDAVHLLYAGERVRAEHPEPAPSLDQVDISGDFAVVALEPLVRMKLVSYRDKDRTHLRDLLDIGLVDPDWLTRFEEPLRERLQQLIDTPDG